MNREVAKVLLKQYIACTNTSKHATIYFFMERNRGLPESIIHVESSKSHRWFTHARKQGFVFQKRLRPMTNDEFFKCIENVDLDGIYIYTRNDEVYCQNNHTRKFVLRCINEFHKFYDEQDKQ